MSHERTCCCTRKSLLELKILSLIFMGDAIGNEIASVETAPYTSRKLRFD